MPTRCGVPTAVGKSNNADPDSMPIMLAKGQRASQATVASDRLASVGYCSSKCVSFHGVKLHVVARQRSGTLPLPG
jgi:hypothetical protein